MERFVETVAESDKNRRKSRDNSQIEFREIRDFIPYKVARRVKEFITFAVKLDGRCPEFHLDEKTKELLVKIDEDNKEEAKIFKLIKEEKG